MPDPPRLVSNRSDTCVCSYVALPQANLRHVRAKFPANFVLRVDATDRFECHLGLELTTKNSFALVSRAACSLFRAGYHLDSPSENWEPL